MDDQARQHREMVLHLLQPATTVGRGEVEQKGLRTLRPQGESRWIHAAEAGIADADSDAEAEGPYSDISAIRICLR